MCRTYGAEVVFVFRAQHCRAGLSCAAPPFLRQGKPALMRGMREILHDTKLVFPFRFGSAESARGF